MKKRTRINIIVITVFIVCALVTVAFGLFLADALPGKISYSIHRIFNHIGTEPAQPVIETNLGYDADDPALKALPADLHGVWLELDADLSTTPEGSYGALFGEATDYFEKFKNVCANTIFIKPDVADKYLGFHDAYGNEVDVLREIMAHADDTDCNCYLIADDSLLFDGDGKPDLEKVRFYLSNYSFAGVLLSGKKLSEENQFSSVVSAVSQQLEGALEKKYLGISVPTVKNNGPASQDVVNALNSGAVSFVVIDAGAAMNSNPGYKTVMGQWNALAGNYSGIRFFAKHRNDLVCSDKNEWSSYLEIANQLRCLWDCDKITGSVFYNASAIRKNVSSSVQRIAALLYDGDSAVAQLKVTSLTVDSAKETVRLTGNAPGNHQFRINGAVASEKGGSFDYVYKLGKGGNRFFLYSCGQELTYKVYNNKDVPAPAWYTDPVSPFTDNGLGNDLICRIVNDNTETLGAAGEKNTYHADYSALTKDTLDYVDRITVSSEGHIRYELRSGLSVYGVNCELISNGYVMPENKIIANSVDDSTPDKTVLYFTTDWFVPVTVKCNPQTYYKGYQSYSFNISDFTAEYVEVKFAHTDQFFNLSNLNFSQNSVFSSTELYADTAGNMLLRLYLRQKGQFYGFNVKHENGQIILTCKKHADGLLSGKVVMLDPGHGGYSMTGTAFNNKIAEKDVTLSIAQKAKQMLEGYGATVLMTRNWDSPLTLEGRCDLIAALDPDIFVSIHCDGTDDPTESGTHTFYFRPYGMPLAKAIHECMVSIYRSSIYAPTDTNYPRIDRGIKYYPFFVTRMNQCPAVLCETGFMSNPIEGMVLTNDNYQYWMARGIADGIRNYFAANY